MPKRAHKRYPTELEHPIMERIKIRVGDTTISAEFVGMRISPVSGYVSHYDLVIKRKGGVYRYDFSLWDHFGKARLYADDLVESFHKFLRRVKGVNHKTCPVCRDLKLTSDDIEVLTDRVSFGEYTVL